MKRTMSPISSTKAISAITKIAQRSTSPGKIGISMLTMMLSLESTQFSSFSASGVAPAARYWNSEPGNSTKWNTVQKLWKFMIAHAPKNTSTPPKIPAPHMTPEPKIGRRFPRSGRAMPVTSSAAAAITAYQENASSPSQSDCTSAMCTTSFS